jgi:hypothetical protein
MKPGVTSERTGTQAPKASGPKTGGANTAATSTGAVATNVVEKAPVDFAAQYGVQAALVNSTPELQALFNQAVSEKWTPAKFQAAFQNTGWYKTNSDTWRSAEATRLTDPASWAEQLNITKSIIRRQSVQLGFELNEEQVAKLADQSLYLAGGSSANIDATTLKTQVVEVGRITGEGGTALQAIDKLKSEAYANGITYNDGWFETAAKDVLVGTGTMEGWSKQIKDAAKSKYASLSDQLDAGLTVRDIASPYIQELASTFEVDQNTVGLEDPMMQRALTGLNESGQPYLTPLWQFQRELKQDDRYFKTNKANQEFTGLATEIAREFGKAV